MPFRDHAKRRTLPALGLALTMLAGCGEHGKTVDREPPAVRLPTTVVQRADLPDFDAIPGAVTSDDRVDISSRVTGYVLLIAVHEGQSVRRGQVLARIDAREIDEAIRQARAGLSAAQADLAHAEEDVVAQEPLAQTGAISRDCSVAPVCGVTSRARRSPGRRPRLAPPRPSGLMSRLPARSTGLLSPGPDKPESWRRPGAHSSPWRRVAACCSRCLCRKPMSGALPSMRRSRCASTASATAP